jgi:hypothetical protein
VSASTKIAWAASVVKDCAETGTPPPIAAAIATAIATSVGLKRRDQKNVANTGSFRRNRGFSDAECAA